VRGIACTLVDDGAVPLEPVTFQGLDDALRGARLFAWWVDVLDAKYPAPATAARLQIAGGRGKQ
jgi:hypothetical protein